MMLGKVLWLDGLSRLPCMDSSSGVMLIGEPCRDRAELAAKPGGF